LDIVGTIYLLLDRGLELCGVCGLVIAVVATLFFGHMSAIEEHPVEQHLVMKQAA